MEPIQHRQPTTRKKNSTKVNITISAIIHVVIIAIGALWAAHEGMLGEKLKTLSASIMDKEKKVVEKKEEPKQEEVKKVEQPKLAEIVKAAPAPPPAFVPPPTAGAAAPPPPVTIGGDFVLSQDAIVDPVIHYKQQVETALRSKWDRPSDVMDLAYVAEVELAIDPAGKIVGNNWKKGSGDEKWDESVRRAVTSTKAFTRPPPKGFPDKVLVRFDVQQETETIIQ
jgi:outer membrane biosynthesis protein TonB